MPLMIRKQCGVSLVELMIAIGISLILLAGVVTLMVRISVSGGESVQSTRLNQQLREPLDRITKDLQRAGYVNWWNAWDDDNGDGDPQDANDDSNETALPDSNGDGAINVVDFYEEVVPAINLFGQVSLFNVSADGSSQTACTTNCNCILFSYDLDEDGMQGVSGSAGANQDTDGFEQFGYRLMNDEIQTRVASAGNSHVCTDTAGGWQGITEMDDVEITALNFSRNWANAIGTGNDSTVFPFVGTSAGSMSNTCTPADGNGNLVLGEIDDTKCLWRRKIAISITGRLASDNAFQLTLTSDVKVKNDYLQTQ